jgi:hypothetical protein
MRRDDTVTTYVSEQVDEVAVLVVATVPLAADDLQQQHAEAVHIGLHREDALGSVLGSHVATIDIYDINRQKGTSVVAKTEHH